MSTNASLQNISQSQLSILNNIRNMFDNQSSFPDFVIKCVDGDILTHKTMLVNIPYFSSMFSGEFRETAQNELVIPDISKKNLSVVLKSLYGFNFSELINEDTIKDKKGDMIFEGLSYRDREVIFSKLHMFGMETYLGDCISALYNKHGDLFRAFKFLETYDDIKDRNISQFKASSNIFFTTAETRLLSIPKISFLYLKSIEEMTLEIFTGFFGDDFVKTQFDFFVKKVKLLPLLNSTSDAKIKELLIDRFSKRELQYGYNSGRVDAINVIISDKYRCLSGKEILEKCNRNYLE